MLVRLQKGALLAALVLVGGCGKEATGQTVAVINGEEVSLNELNTELAAAKVPDSADKKQVMPQLLQRIIDRRVLAQQATEQGIERSPEYLTRQRRMNEELLIGLYTERLVKASEPPSQQEIDQFIAENPGKFRNRALLTLEQIQFQQPADPTILRQMEDDRSLDDVAQTLTALGIPFKRGTGRLDTATLPEQTFKQIMSLPSGEPFVIPVGQQMVASVIRGREAASLPGEVSRELAAELIQRRKLNERLDNELKQLRKSAKIEYQDGYAPPRAAPSPAAKSTS